MNPWLKAALLASIPLLLAGCNLEAIFGCCGVPTKLSALPPLPEGAEMSFERDSTPTELTEPVPQLPEITISTSADTITVIGVFADDCNDEHAWNSEAGMTGDTLIVRTSYVYEQEGTGQPDVCGTVEPTGYEYTTKLWGFDSGEYAVHGYNLDDRHGNLTKVEQMVTLP